MEKMQTEWWEEHFKESFNRFLYIFRSIIKASLSIRLVFSVFYSFKEVFNKEEIYHMFVVMLLVVFLESLKNSSSLIRKIVLYALIELLNFALRTSSLAELKDHSNLLCLESTLLTLLFQTNVFLNLHINILISIKHITLWYIIGDDIEISADNLTPVLIFMVITVVWCLFESDKRKTLKSAYDSKIKEKEACSQVLEILKFFTDGLIIISKDLKVCYLNESAKNIIQVEIDEDISNISSIKLYNTECSILDQILKLNSNFETGFLGITKISGCLYEWTSQNISWDKKKCYMIKVKDVTKILEVERLKSENKSKTFLLRSISHELKTPINAILLTVDQILQERPKDPGDKLKIIKTCGNLLNFKINDILDYSEIFFNNFCLKKSMCNLKSCMAECVDYFREQAKHKGLELVCDFSKLNYTKCMLDKYRLQKIIVNLLSNSIKFTNRGLVTLKAESSEDSAIISVEDTGIGISNDFLCKIFEIFSDESNSGLTRLGLHISKQVLSYFGSDIKVKSEVGKGSVFSFELKNIFNSDSYPDSEIPSERGFVTAPKKSIKFFERTFPKIMVVDDNDFNRMCVGRILNINGFHFIEAVNGKDAVDMVANCDMNKTPLSLIIMDCNMPVMDGWEATAEINRMFEKGVIGHLPAIIGHTAYSSSDDIRRCYESGMISYLLKPTSKDELLSIVNQHLL